MRDIPSHAGVDPHRRRLLTHLGAATLLPLLGRAGSSDATTPPLRPTRSPLLPPEHALRLPYATPASDAQLLREGLPIGNGRLGALCGGAPACETLFVSEGSLWSGGSNAVLQDDGQFAYTKEEFGSFMLLAKLFVELEGHAQAQVSDYQRELDMSNGCVRVRYRIGNTRYTRTLFASHPDAAIVLRLDCEGAGSHRGRIRLVDTHAGAGRADGRAGLRFAGQLDNGLRYAAALRVHSDGGRLETGDGLLQFHDCRGLTIVLCGDTDYAADGARGWRDATRDPLALARNRAQAAATVPAALLLDTHVADHRALFDTLQVELGQSSDAQRGLETWQRIQARAATPALPDPELEVAYLQFGRYLTIAASRDGLPTNLQGLWLKNNDPPWMSDYHSDVNLQMNNWLADPSGLGACVDALTRYCLAQLPSWTRITQTHFNDPRNRFRNTSGKIAGWTVAISTNPFGGNGWYWHPAGNAWLCDSLWQHYEFTQDRDDLTRIYPLLKGACEFWQARLIAMEVTDADGSTRQCLVDDHDWSPEHGPENARGIAYAQELVWTLFGQYRQASALLGRDAAYAATIATLQQCLYLPEISPLSGQLQEWMSPTDLGEAHHRHLSPLMGLFPGHRLHPDLAPPAQLEAARKLLEARGMQSFGWACAWRALCWARLGDAERAYALVLTNLKPSIGHSNGTAPNLFDIYDLSQHGDPTLGGVFQIDANFGTPAAMLEMLLYSRPGQITLLPALPKAWAAQGRVTGLGARGGFTVDMAWRNGVPTQVSVRSVGGTRTRLSWGAQAHDITLARGQVLRVL
ncbi:hypothetical protein DGM85_12445 [Xanthomonas phaseoli pv. phaseoli]|uniref:glycoside hydrolase family 95 protein n=1 Tax=Xanthomonas phaseoli TaxID=1985254 RepID=UPI001C0474C4|nr:glycoside hydrolase family 95 protein [Xanthomonas phaseoli]QWN29194.1 hypothetical protein DGM85_12445 [Xanthomonas phaseoli pv. phaseoli]